MAVDPSAFPFQAWITEGGEPVQGDPELVPGEGFIGAWAAEVEAIAACNRYAFEHRDEEVTLFDYSEGLDQVVERWPRDNSRE